MKKLLLLCVFLAACSSGGGGSPIPIPDPVPSAQCGPLLETPPRGLSTLHCLNDTARPQCEGIVKIVKDACIKNVTLSYLVNGTFGRNLSHIQHDIHTLAVEGRKLHLVLYLYNGPGQRRCKSTSDNSWDVRMCPPTFRHKVRSDGHTRNQVIQDTRLLLPLIAFAEERGAKVYMIPMLEDNLDQGSFFVLASLMKPILPSSVVYGRNPCPSCYSGNDDGIPDGFFRDKHTGDSNAFSSSNGLITNDGVDYVFPGETTTYPRVVPFSTLKSARNKAGETGNLFILWKACAQGLTGGTLPPPSGRHYCRLENGQDILKRFLRGS
jgi:hypothetical protein